MLRVLMELLVLLHLLVLMLAKVLVPVHSLPTLLLLLLRLKLLVRRVLRVSAHQCDPNPAAGHAANPTAVAELLTRRAELLVLWVLELVGVELMDAARRAVGVRKLLWLYVAGRAVREGHVGRRRRAVVCLR